MIVAGIDVNKSTVAIAKYNTVSKHLVLKKLSSEQGNRAAQLRVLAELARPVLTNTGAIYVEEPVIGINKRSSLQVAITAGAIATVCCSPTYFVPVTVWKADIVGRGNATKDDVSDWLNANHVTYSAKCDGDQDLTDATCIALYGAAVQDLASRFALLRHQ
jgi:Holliday junction resolvasome RuvABC endonuclease subunit